MARPTGQVGKHSLRGREMNTASSKDQFSLDRTESPGNASAVWRWRGSLYLPATLDADSRAAEGAGVGLGSDASALQPAPAHAVRRAVRGRCGDGVDRPSADDRVPARRAGARPGVHARALRDFGAGASGHEPAHRLPSLRDQRLGLRVQRAAAGAGSVLPGRPDAGRGAAAGGSAFAPVHASGCQPVQALPLASRRAS